MKVLGIYVYESFFSNRFKDYPIFSFQNIAIGFTAILNEIQRQNNELDTIACSLNANIEDVLKDYDIKQYDLACFTTITSQVFYTYKFAKELKKLNKNIKIIVGGPHATIDPEDVANHREIDGIAIGEGIESIKLYLKYLKKEISVNQVDGYWIREGNKVIKNKRIEFISFEKWPAVDMSIWDKWVFDKTRHSVIISRGCVNRCSYCSNNKTKLGNVGTYISFRKVEDIVKELLLLIEKYEHVKYVELESESVSINLNFTYELFDALEKLNNSLTNKLFFEINVHLTSLLLKNMTKFIDALKRANVKLVSIGFESGSYRIRKQILHRPEYTNKDFITFCKALMEKDISVSVFVLLGLPTETEYNLKQTISVLNKIKPTEIKQSIFYPYPNTDLYDLMVKMKLIKSKQILKVYPERRSTCVEYPNLSRETIQKYYNKLENMAKNTKFAVLSKMLLNKIDKS